MKHMAEIRNDNGISTLYVDGQPFQAFAGEVHNSAAYDPERMEIEIWEKMEQSNLNTLIVPVYWETLEPEEGKFDFTLVDALIKQADKYKKKLILLWFGLWKNAESASLLYERMAEAVSVVSGFLSVRRTGRGYAVGMESSGAFTFTIGPDIYVPYVSDIMKTYSRPDNPLLIPEVRKDAVTASYALYAFLHFHALCYAPFGVEDLWADQPSDLSAEVIDALKLDPLSFNLSGTKETLGEVYRLLEEIRPLYLKYRGTEHMKCFLKQSDGEQGCYLKFKNYDIEIQYLPRTDGAPAAAGVVFELDENTFLIIGMMCSIRFHTKPGDHRRVDFLTKEAGTFHVGKWVCEQRQNGDEKIVSVLYNMPGCFRIETFKY